MNFGRIGPAILRWMIEGYIQFRKMGLAPSSLAVRMGNAKITVAARLV
jgi:hypothetical protein